MIRYILFGIELITVIYLTFNIFYITIYSFGAFFYRKTKFKYEVNKFNRFAILIPDYKSDEVILNYTLENLKQSYNKDYFDLIVIADSLKDETLEKFNTYNINLIPVKFEVSTKLKSLNTALSLLHNKYDYCCVLDVNNIMEFKFLEKINYRLQNNEMVVQAHRTAKNSNTSFTVLDGISEEIDNNIFRKGHIGLGVASALIGSVFVIQFDYFKKILLNIDSPVENKELEIILLKDKYRILYENDAIVYDEKVASSYVFMNQRRSWIASQFVDFNKILFDGIIELVVKNNFDFFDKAMQKILLPRVLLLGLSGLCALTVFFNFFHYGFFFLILFSFCSLSYFLGIPSKYYNLKTLMAALTLPKAIVLMIVALIKRNDAASTFTIDNNYDAVVCSEVLEHRDKPWELAEQTFKILKSGGVFVATEPNGHGPREIFITRPMQWLHKHNLDKPIVSFKKFLGYDSATLQSSNEDLTQIQFYNVKTFTDVLNKVGFKNVKWENADFIERIFPYSILTKRIPLLQKIDCDFADHIPKQLTCGFYTPWTK
jgi:SAM-dependent methyltransferase